MTKLKTTKNHVDDLAVLWSRSRKGDQDAFARLFELRRRRLLREAQRGLGNQMQRRMDASDVVQEVFLEASRRVGELATGDVPELLWLRVLLKQKVVDCKRMHLKASKRSLMREQSLEHRVADEDPIAEQLVTELTSPSLKVRRDELRAQLRELLAELPMLDRQILVLRHFEAMTNREVAEALELSINAASNRYVRAIRRFRELLDAKGIGLDDSDECL